MKIHLKKLVFGIVLLSIVIGFAVVANAAYTIPDIYRPKNIPTISGSGNEPAQAYSIKGAQLFIGNIISIILILAGSLSVYAILTNAWWMIASGGKQETIDTRKKGLTWAILGLVFTLLSYIIVKFLIQLPVLSFEQTEGEISGGAKTQRPDIQSDQLQPSLGEGELELTPPPDEYVPVDGEPPPLQEPPDVRL